MAKTTGIVIAIGGLTVANRVLFNSMSMDWRVPVATGIAALMFGGAEKVWPEGAQMLAWTALTAVVFTRIEPDVPSPLESALDWWKNPPSVTEEGEVEFPGGKNFGKHKDPGEVPDDPNKHKRHDPSRF